MESAHMFEEKRISRSLGTVSVMTAFMLLPSCGGVPAIPDPPVPVIESDRTIDDSRGGGVELSWMDPEVSPGDDFYTYACGGWLSNTGIPEGRFSYGGFDASMEEIDQDLLLLLQMDSDGSDSLACLARTLFSSGVNLDAVESVDLEPLAYELVLIDEIEDFESLSRALAHLQLIGVTPFFRIHKPIYWEVLDMNYLYLRQTTLGAADGLIHGREADEENNEIHREYISELLFELGYGSAQADELADGIISLEQRLSSFAMTGWEMRDFRENYNPLSPDNLEDLTGQIIWDEIFAGLNIQRPSKIIVGQLDYFEEVGRILEEADWDLIRAYCHWALLCEFAPVLSSRFSESSSRYRELILGESGEVIREEQILRVVDREMPDILGSMYLSEYFPQFTRMRVMAMIANLRVAYDARLRSSIWLDDDTRAHALAKLANLTFAIGGHEAPDYYDNLSLEDDTFLANILAVRRLRMREHLQGTDQQWEVDVWTIEAHDSNAWYLPAYNTILLSAAGINTMFREDCDDAYNYGTSGARFAHEMTHAFDQSGRLYDEECRRHQWWSANDEEEYGIIFDRFTVFFEELGDSFNLEIDGSYTFDENFADAVGLQVAYDAFCLSLDGSEPAMKDGFSGPQRFFIAYAQEWRELLSPAAMRSRLRGMHSPPQIRTNGPAALCPAFHEAFPESMTGLMHMESEDIIQIW